MEILGRLTWLITTILLVTVAVTFAASNQDLVTLYLWPFDSTLTAPNWLVVLFAFIIGGLLSLILLWAQWLAIRTKLWRLQVKFNKLEASVIQEHNAAGSPNDKRAKKLHTANYTSNHRLKDQEAGTVVSEPLRTDLTLR